MLITTYNQEPIEAIMNQHATRNEGVGRTNSRRVFLATIAGGSVVLTGCLGDGEDGSTEDDGDTDEDEYDLPVEVLTSLGVVIDETEDYDVEEARGAYDGQTVSFMLRLTNHREEESIMEYTNVSFLSEGGNSLGYEWGNSSFPLPPGETSEFAIEHDVYENINAEDVASLRLNFDLDGV